MLQIGQEYQIADAIAIPFPPDAGGNERAYRRWTGAGTWTYQGQAFVPGGIVEVGDIELGSALAQATGITLAVVTDEERALFLGHDAGPIESTIYELWRKRSSGGSWPAWTITAAYSGQLSTASYADGQITIELQQIFNDVWRGVPLRWTGTDQRRRFEGDSGLDRADRMRRSGLVVAGT